MLEDHLNTTTKRYNMEICPDKKKTITKKKSNDFQRQIKINGHMLEAVGNFKYL